MVLLVIGAVPRLMPLAMNCTLPVNAGEVRWLVTVAVSVMSKPWKTLEVWFAATLTVSVKPWTVMFCAAEVELAVMASPE